MVGFEGTIVYMLHDRSCLDCSSRCVIEPHSWLDSLITVQCPAPIICIVTTLYGNPIQYLHNDLMLRLQRLQQRSWHTRSKKTLPALLLISSPYHRSIDFPSQLYILKPCHRFTKESCLLACICIYINAQLVQIPIRNIYIAWMHEQRSRTYY